MKSSFVQVFHKNTFRRIKNIYEKHIDLTREVFRFTDVFYRLFLMNSVPTWTILEAFIYSIDGYCVIKEFESLDLNTIPGILQAILKIYCELMLQ